MKGEGEAKKEKKNKSGEDTERNKKRTMSQRHYGFVSTLSEGDHSPSSTSSSHEGRRTEEKVSIGRGRL
jgi:hypothetical protein